MITEERPFSRKAIASNDGCADLPTMTFPLETANALGTALTVTTGAVQGSGAYCDSRNCQAKPILRKSDVLHLNAGANHGQRVVVAGQLFRER